jgi:hypothetical protein
VLTGARSLIAVSEWITDAPQHVLGVLGFAADPLTGLRPVPHAATVRRLLQRVDGDALDAAISAYLQARTPRPVEPETKKGPVRRVIAVDGKVVRGSRTKTATAIQLLAAMDHHGVVLAQRQVASKSNEIPSFAPLLDGLDLQNAVVTADALHTRHDHRACLTGCGAHYVAVVKKNHHTSSQPWETSNHAPVIKVGRSRSFGTRTRESPGTSFTACPGFVVRGRGGRQSSVRAEAPLAPPKKPPPLSPPPLFWPAVVRLTAVPSATCWPGSGS